MEGAGLGTGRAASTHIPGARAQGTQKTACCPYAANRTPLCSAALRSAILLVARSVSSTI